MCLEIFHEERIYRFEYIWSYLSRYLTAKLQIPDVQYDDVNINSYGKNEIFKKGREKRGKGAKYFISV